jgi:predicted transcriptional regulator
VDGLRQKRELVGLSQIALSRQAGISRMRLQLAEAGQLSLRSEEVESVSRVLREAIERRTAALANALTSPAANLS